MGQTPPLPTLLRPPPSLDRTRCTKYFLRCLRTYLPSAYTSNDSNRISLAFFILLGLDLLGALSSQTTPAERAEWIQWIYALQHPGGGFRGFPGAKLGRDATREGHEWDPANLPGTYFALCALLILGDDLRGVKRGESLEWLGGMQRDDGSFGETRVEGRIQGGRDSRFGYCASAVRYMLCGPRAEDRLGMRVDELVECVSAAECYDGGMSDSPFHESHAGFTYCAIASLSFLGRLCTDTTPYRDHDPGGPMAPTDPAATINFLVSRQTATISDKDAFDTNADETDTPETCHDAHTFVGPTGKATAQGTLSFTGRPSKSFDLEWIGMNGRCNKIGDTCYAFWVTGALTLMGRADLLSIEPIRRWLLEQTAHPALGGFGKHADDLPDVYHSALGLAALSLMRESSDGLKELDPGMCIPVDARERLPAIWRRWGVEP